MVRTPMWMTCMTAIMAALGCSDPVVTLHSSVPAASAVEHALQGTWRQLVGDSTTPHVSGTSRLVLSPREGEEGGYGVRLLSQDGEVVLHGRSTAAPGGFLFETWPAVDLDIEPLWARRAFVPVRTPYLLSLSGDTLEVRVITGVRAQEDTLAAVGIPWTTRSAGGFPATEGVVVISDSALLRRHMPAAFEAVGERVRRYVREPAPAGQ